jgi:hypothetical protein
MPAKAEVDNNPRLPAGHGAGRAVLHANAAARASIGQIYLSGNLLPALGVVAPPATQRTALQEDSGPDARAVMGGEPHYIENIALNIYCIHRQTCGIQSGESHGQPAKRF